MNDPCCPGELRSPLPDEVSGQLARRLGALADPARVQIVAILAAARRDTAGPGSGAHECASNHAVDPADAGSGSGGVAPGSVCACDFVGPLGKSQPTVSHHLKVLSTAGLVVGERHGRWIWYRLADEGVATLADDLATLGIAVGAH
jgi:ArsR family transcriptional regulator